MSNLKKIQLFLDDKMNSSMVLPKVSAEILIFYQILIQEIAIKQNFIFKRIENFKNTDELTTSSLFGDRYVYLIETNLTKSTTEDFDKIKNSSQKFFIFLNYASFKRNILNSVQLNAYDYKKDIISFSKTDQNFNSFDDKKKGEFLAFSYVNPHLFFSELQKSTVQTSISRSVEADSPDTILSVRKEIFKHKSDFSARVLPQLYSLFKKEVRIKKFNF